MYSTNVTAARMSEAVAGAGTIRSAARTYLATHGGTFPTTAPTLTDLGFGANDLDGKFAKQADYTFTPTASSSTYTVTYTPDSTASGLGMKDYKIDQAGVESGTWKTGN